MEILRNIQPEDIEDVSERYVPLYSTQRECDTVKKVNISKYLPRKQGEKESGLPLYVISLIEHKTKVEYNIGMQILRYMVYIWEDYEKEMEKRHSGISRRKEFKYPPILPVVYYEGKGKWTAPSDLSERILCGEVLGKYLPHFCYQLVRLHDYSNEELLEKGDEISLAMLINKIQSAEDMEAFTGLPGEKAAEILKETPDYLLETMANVLRALLYSMNMPEEETEKAAAIIKERKMGRLFENVKMDIQAERRKFAEEQAERKRAEEERKKAETEWKKAETEWKRAEAERDAVMLSFEIYRQISRMLRDNCSCTEIKETLIRKFLLTEEQAEAEYKKVLEE